jgi:hypothetical protein
VSSLRSMGLTDYRPGGRVGSCLSSFSISAPDAAHDHFAGADSRCGADR